MKLSKLQSRCSLRPVSHVLLYTRPLGLPSCSVQPGQDLGFTMQVTQIRSEFSSQLKVECGRAWGPREHSSGLSNAVAAVQSSESSYPRAAAPIAVPFGGRYLEAFAQRKLRGALQLWRWFCTWHKPLCHLSSYS